MGIKNEQHISRETALEMTGDMDVKNGTVRIEEGDVVIVVDSNIGVNSHMLEFSRHDDGFSVVISGEVGMMLVQEWRIVTEHTVKHVDIGDSYIIVMHEKVMSKIKEKIDNE